MVGELSQPFEKIIIAFWFILHQALSVSDITTLSQN